MTRMLPAVLLALLLAAPAQAKAPTASEVEAMLLRAEGEGRTRLDEARAHTAAEEEALSTAKAQLDGAKQAAAAAAARIGSAKAEARATRSELKAAQRVGDDTAARALTERVDQTERVLAWRIARRKAMDKRVTFQTRLLAQKKADVAFAEAQQAHTELEVYALLMGDSADAAVEVGKALGKLGSAQRKAASKNLAAVKARTTWQLADEAAAALTPEDTAEALLAAREVQLLDLLGLLGHYTPCVHTLSSPPS